MTRKRIVIIGDSHTDALKKALRKPPAAWADFDMAAYRFVQAKDGKAIGDLTVDQAVELVGALGPDDLVVSATGGNQHQVVALMQHPVAFDFFFDHHPEVAPEGVCMIPQAQMRDFFETGIGNNDGSRLEELVKAARSRVIHLVPPPPKEDAQHILSNHESYFAKSGIAERGVSPAPFRLKVWRLQVEVLRRLSARWGADLLMPPACSTTADGYLAPDFYAADATHGNAAYGRAVIDQLVAIVQGQALQERESHVG